MIFAYIIGAIAKSCEGLSMIFAYIIGALAVVAIMIYVVIALIRPERF